ncbi:MAG: glycosyltransferase family 2 protein [Rhodospirillales bacterium]|jgi:glycosyltransferase involved in cell wall biosynthesis
MISLSIIIPVYNEQATIIELLKSVNRQSIDGVEFEVVVIDDGSSDQTVERLNSHPELYKTFIQLPKNGGKGAAVKAGLKKATGDYVLFQDADLEYNPDEYANLLFPLLEFGAEIVMGSRMKAPRYTRIHYFWHLVGNRILTLLFNILFNSTYSDIYSCYLMYKRELVDADQLRSTGWEQHGEILAKATKKAKVIYEVPISYHGRSYEEGKKIKAIHVIPVIWMLIRQRFSRS